MLGNNLDKPILVIGTGDLGRRIAGTLLASGSQDVRVFSRRPRGPEGTKLVPGDVTEAASVKAATGGVGGVVIAVESSSSDNDPNGPERVHHRGVRNVVSAADPDTYIVLVTQIYVTRPSAAPSMVDVIRARQYGEGALRASGLPYTIVRPSWLDDEEGGRQGLRLEQGDMGEGRVAREDVATVCVQALFNKTAAGKTFEVYNEVGTPPADWESLFRPLLADPETMFPDQTRARL